MENSFKVVSIKQIDKKNKTTIIKAVKMPTVDGLLNFKELRGNEPILFKFPVGRYQELLDSRQIVSLGQMNKEQITEIFKVK